MINRKQPLIKALLERRSAPAKWSGRLAFGIYFGFLMLISAWLLGYVSPKHYVAGLALLFIAPVFIIILALWGMAHVWNTGYQGGKRASFACFLMLPLVITLTLAIMNVSKGQITHDVWTGKSITKPDYESLALIRSQHIYRAAIPDRVKESGFLKAPPAPPLPVIMDISMQEAVSFAVLTAQLDMGWSLATDIPDIVTENFKFEATDNSFPLFFKDDIIVVLEEKENGIHINARSSSRIGQHDFGANRKRIAAYFRLIERRAAATIYNPDNLSIGLK